MPMSINRSSMAPVAVMPGAGETHSIVGMTVTFKITGRQSHGQFAVLEIIEPPGSGSPTQLHEQMTMLICMLEGTLTVRVGDETIHMAPGSYAYIPPGTVYAMSNQSDTPAKYLMVTSPAGIEDYIAEAIDLVESEPSWPPADMSRFIVLRAKHGFVDPPDV